MKRIDKVEKNRAIKILIDSLKDIPGVLRIIKIDDKFKVRLHAFCTFCIEIATLRYGAYMTDDRNGIALFFKNTRKVPLFPFLIAYLKLGHNCIGWERVIPILRKQSIIRRKRPKIRFLHFWILAVAENTYGLRTIMKIRDFTFAKSKELALPIIAETRMERNKKLYERYGFYCYDTLAEDEGQTTVYFLRRDPC